MRKSKHTNSQLLLDVAQNTQQFIKTISDILEKLRHLFEWRRPKITLKFIYVLLFFFLPSLVFSISSWLIFIG